MPHEHQGQLIIAALKYNYRVVGSNPTRSSKVLGKTTVAQWFFLIMGEGYDKAVDAFSQYIVFFTVLLGP